MLAALSIQRTKFLKRNTHISLLSPLTIFEMLQKEMFYNININVIVYTDQPVVDRGQQGKYLMCMGQQTNPPPCKLATVTLCL